MAYRKCVVVVTVVGLIVSGTPQLFAAAKPNIDLPATIAAERSVAALPPRLGMEWLIPLPSPEEVPARGSDLAELQMSLAELQTGLRYMATRVPSERMQVRLNRLAALSAASVVMRTGTRDERRRALDELGVTIVKERSGSVLTTTISVNGKMVLRLTGDATRLRRPRPLPSEFEQPDGASRIQSPEELVDAADAEAQLEQDYALGYLSASADEIQLEIDEVSYYMSQYPCADGQSSLAQSEQDEANDEVPGNEAGGAANCWDYAVGFIVDGAVAITTSISAAANIRNAYNAFKAAVTAPALAYLAYAEFAAAIQAALTTLISAISAEVALPAILIGGAAYLFGRWSYCYFFASEPTVGPMDAISEGFATSGH